MNHRRRFLARLVADPPGVIERNHLSLGAQPGMRWEDKHPHYADPKTDPHCLDTIDLVFPGSRFVHVIRDGRAVVASIVWKGWADLPEAIDV